MSAKSYCIHIQDDYFYDGGRVHRTLKPFALNQRAAILELINAKKYLKEKGKKNMYPSIRLILSLNPFVLANPEIQKEVTEIRPNRIIRSSGKVLTDEQAWDIAFIRSHFPPEPRDFQG